MSVRIRLTRVGATGQPSYRVVATDRRRARDGRSLETLGHYNPRTEPMTLVLDLPKVDAWISKGAQPSEVVGKLIAKARAGGASAGGRGNDYRVDCYNGPRLSRQEIGQRQAEVGS